MENNKVFEPLKIGPLIAKNRIELSPAEPMLATYNGLVTPEFISFTQNFAKGGAAIVTVGDSPVTKEYAAENRFVIDLSNDNVTHGLFSLTDAIHRYGALASIELNIRDDRKPDEFQPGQIDKMIDDFASAAARCRKAGFDMVLLHGGHGHTVASFYSHNNTRKDKYGCSSMEDRCRFACDVIDAVREKIGPAMAIEWRISGDEFIAGGVGVDEAISFVQYVQDKIDMIHVSAGGMYNSAASLRMIQPTYLPRATNLYLAEEFKKAVDIPVCSVGSFNMELASKAINEGRVDMVAMIRSLIADPMAVRKHLYAQDDTIRPCLRCNLCTGGPDPHGNPKPLRCSVNPLAGRERLIEPEPVIRAKKVLIAGGGCAGMEAARWLAERGHHPIIIEKTDRLGGTLIAAGGNPLKSDVKKYREWSVRETERNSGIDVRLNTEFTRSLVETERPDALIIATGAIPFIPELPGIHGKNVVLAKDVDLGAAEVGHTVVVAGAGLTGTETAVSLAQAGHDVTLIDMLTLAKIDAASYSPLARSIRIISAQAGVKVIEKVSLSEVLENGITVKNEEDAEYSIPCDTLVLALGVRPAPIPAEVYKGLVQEVYSVGDCTRRNGTIATAVKEGFYAAMNI